MSRYPRYPSSSSAGHQQLRNPWVSEQQQQLECRESQSTNSSSSSRTYHQRGPGPPTSLWLPPRPTTHFQPSPDQVEALVEGPLLAPPPAAVVRSASSRAASERDRPVTPASSPGGMSSGGAVDGCGGHCVAFENFCYYCLQVIFIAGILTGVSLTIAGGVLRGQSRGGDLLVLVYIGCMIALVCSLLLSVQCCVRRNVKRRKRALRTAREQRNAARHATDMIPMQDLATAANQYQPLLIRLVQQQQTASTSVTDQRLHPHHQLKIRTTDERLEVSRSGTPWWRRHAQSVTETRH